MLTWPLVAPLAPLDAGQRHFGAVLELATLTSAICMPILAYLLWAWLDRRADATAVAGGSS
jgi:hypothetical protein